MTHIDPADFDIDPARGFLPKRDPLSRLPPAWAAWDELGAELPALLLAGRAREWLSRMPVLDIAGLADGLEAERAMLLLSTFAGAHVWGGAEPDLRLPRPIAAPLWAMAERLGRKPIISHASNVLHNWRRIDPAGGVTLDNLAMLQGFLTSSDEAWFVLVTVAIEAVGAPAVRELARIQSAIAGDEPAEVGAGLDAVAATVDAMTATLQRMYEQCDPHVFFHRVRPYLAGWPAPGLVYAGVREQPVMLSGGSAAQSSLVQALDAALGVRHASPASRPFLAEMRGYMPAPHRRFLSALDAGPDAHAYVAGREGDLPELKHSYNRCIDALDHFRKLHMEIAVRYITLQSPKRDDRGTGGTSFTAFLGAAKRETRDSRLG